MHHSRSSLALCRAILATSVCLCLAAHSSTSQAQTNGNAVSAGGAPAGAAPASQVPPLRVAVVGGIVMCGVWAHLVPRIEQATHVHIDTVGAAPKVAVLPQFRSGQADLLLIHGGTETFGLQAEGMGGQQRVWAFNEHVIVGPRDDPAKIRQSATAEAAFRAMATSRAPFVAFRDPGSHEIVQNVWKRMGLKASPDWVLLDETPYPQSIVAFAASKHAYAVVGAIPMAFEKLQAEGMVTLFRGDRAMRRAYVVVEPGSRHPASPLAREQAARVANYLVSPDGQAALEDADRASDGPWLFTLQSTTGQPSRADSEQAQP